MRAGRIDSAQPAIRTDLERHGILTEPMPKPGDLLCWGFHRVHQIWMHVAMEVKSDPKTRGYKRELTLAQAKRERRGFKIPLIHDSTEALACYGIDPPQADGEKKD